MFNKKRLEGYGLIAPTFITILLLSYLPLPYSIFLSLNKTTPATGELEYVGLQNYKTLFSEARLWNSISVTGVYILLGTAVLLVFGLIVALILNSGMKGCMLYMTILFIPWVISSVAASQSWRWLLDEDFGVLNYIFSWMEGSDFRISDITHTQKYAMLGLTIVTLWRMLAFSTLLILAGLQSITKDIYEAASIDGCSRWQTFRHIVLPLISPTLLVVGMMIVINLINQAEIPLLLTNGGPLRATETIGLMMYNEAFVNFHLNDASSLAVVMGMINIVIVIIYIILNNRAKEVLGR